MKLSEFPGFPYRLATLFGLYLVQGMPYGFFLTVLPIFLREAGWTRTSLGFLGVLGLPWFLKPIWAPIVDRYWFPRIGRRKSWILPCMGICLALTLVAATAQPQAGRPVAVVLVPIFLLILFTATQDIAVDGLAVDILHTKERGPGNAAQVVGFKVGMLLTGGVMLAFSDRVGWKGICWGMASVTILMTVWFVTFQEGKHSLRVGSPQPPSVHEIIKALISMTRGQGFVFALLLIATYKMGEAGVDAMYKIFLLDRGMSGPEIGAMCGGWGMAFSLAGSVCGGWIGIKRERLSALARAGIIRAIPLCAIAVLPFLQNPLAGWLIYPVTLLEHFAGGLITPIMFAFMMDLCDRNVGATHFTVLATVEVVGKMSVSTLSGLVCDRIGYGGLFCLAAGISLAWPLLVLYSRRRMFTAPALGPGSRRGSRLSPHPR